MADIVVTGTVQEFVSGANFVAPAESEKGSVIYAAGRFNESVGDKVEVKMSSKGITSFKVLKRGIHND